MFFRPAAAQRAVRLSAIGSKALSVARSEFPRAYHSHLPRRHYRHTALCLPVVLARGRTACGTPRARSAHRAEPYWLMAAPGRFPRAYRSRRRAPCAAVVPRAAGPSSALRSCFLPWRAGIAYALLMPPVAASSPMATRASVSAQEPVGLTMRWSGLRGRRTVFPDVSSARSRSTRR